MKEQLRLKNIVQFKQYPNEYWVVEELLMGNLTLSDSENNFSFEKNVSYDEIEGVPLTE